MVPAVGGRLRFSLMGPLHRRLEHPHGSLLPPKQEIQEGRWRNLPCDSALGSTVTFTKGVIVFGPQSREKGLGLPLEGRSIHEFVNILKLHQIPVIFYFSRYPYLPQIGMDYQYFFLHQSQNVISRPLWAAGIL